MGSIPLPALDIRPPQPFDYLGQLGKVTALKGMLQQQQFQQQMQPLQLQQEQNVVRQQALQFKSQQAIADAYIKSNGDLNQTMDLARQNGALPNDLLALQQHTVQMQAALATKTKTELENISTQHDNLRGVLDPIVAADPAKQPQMWASAKQNILNDPDHATKYGITDPSQVPDYQSPQQVQLFDAALKGGKAQIEDKLKTAETAKTQAQAALEQIKVNLSQNSKPGDFDALINQAVGALPPQTAAAVAQRNRSLVNFALSRGDYEGAQTVIKQMYGEVSGFEKERFSQAEENWRQGLNRQAMFANELQKAGLNEIDKQWTDPQHGYLQTQSQVAATKDLVSQSKNGSDLASSLVPLMTVLGVNSYAGVHRVSPSEMTAAGPQMGSAFRRLNTILDKYATGSVPTDTLKEVNGIMDSLLTARHQQAINASAFIAKSRGLDPSKTPIMTPQGGVTTLSDVQGQAGGGDWGAQFGGVKR